MLRNSSHEEHRRKRVRKGTKSCWECKRRKIKCIPSPESSICTGCLERSTPCLSQEFVDDIPSHHAEDSILARRMARMESLLETLMERIPPGQIGDDLTLVSTMETANRPRPLFAPQPVECPAHTGVSPETGKTEILRKQLASMLPCQADVDFLLLTSHGWWLIQQHIMTHLPESTHNMFNVDAVSQGRPITIAILLLCIVICMQQLPPDMDKQRIQALVPVRESISSIMEFLVQNVTSNDEITASIEGVECLALQGIYEVNAGNLRRSWLSYRKAVTISQLLGLHRVSVKTPTENQESTEIRNHLWYQVSRGERYLSTILGVPSATGPAAFPFDDDPSPLSPEDIHHQHLYHIAGLILARNQEDSLHSFSTTLKIGEQLDALANQMPSTWWEVPTNIANNRTKEASKQFERVMCQIWHFELETLLHLPFMLRAATDRRYEYSRVACLNASRSLIRRWLAIRESHGTFYFSNLLEFEAFTAATTLLLGLLGQQKSAQPDLILERLKDSQLVETVVQNFERLRQQGCGMSVGDQSISVIRILQRFHNEENLSGNLCLEIPFFGTIRVTCGGALRPLDGERILGANSPGNHFSNRSAQCAVPSLVMTADQEPNLVPSLGMNPLRETVGTEGNQSVNDVSRSETIVQFNGGHFQLTDTPDNQDGLEESDWTFQQSDMIFFDSLVNTDLVGNWTF